jgi:hypothetical protein
MLQAWWVARVRAIMALNSRHKLPSNLPPPVPSLGKELRIAIMTVNIATEPLELSRDAQSALEPRQYYLGALRTNIKQIANAMGYKPQVIHLPQRRSLGSARIPGKAVNDGKCGPVSW